MREPTHEEWQQTMWTGLIVPWRDKLPLREQRVCHLILSDWLEDRGEHVAAQIIREGHWYLYLDVVLSRYRVSGICPHDWGGPRAMHWWPRAYSDPAPMELADLDDALLDSELWTYQSSS